MPAGLLTPQPACWRRDTVGVLTWGARVDARRVLWGAVVVGFLAIAVSGPVAMLRERRATASPAGTATGGAPATAPVVRMENIAFVPATLTVRPGTRVRFENRDVAPHTVTAAAPGGIDSGTINPGRSFELVVSQPFDYVCTIHPSMKAKILLSG